MPPSTPNRHAPAPPFVARALLVILSVAVLGTLAELLLLEHYEDWKQWVPLAVLGLAALVIGWQAYAPSAASRRLFQLLMLSLVVAGVAGVVLHVRGNLEFERELNPGASGWSLWLEVARGATPTLAPGSLIPFGLLGLLYAARSSALLPQDS